MRVMMNNIEKEKMIDNTQLQSGNLFDGRYILINPISSDGGSADVWLARDRNTIDEQIDAEEGTTSIGNEESGLLVAIKVYRPKNALDIEGEQMFRDEYKIVHDCHHTNLLQPFDFSVCQGIPYLVLPFCQDGSSKELIGKLKSDDDIWKYIHDVASGLDYLHTNTPEIVHQDIKPANILIDKRGNYVITDFGISTTIGKRQDDFFEKNSGTFSYMAPERFEDDIIPLRESDIWSVGATLYELLIGQPPYGEGGGGAQAVGDPMVAPLDGVPGDIKKLILACLSLNPKERPTARQLMIAAEQRQFPPRKSSRLPLLLFFSIVVCAVVAFFGLRPKEITLVSEQLTVEQMQHLYDSVMPIMITSDPDSMRQAIEVLKQLDAYDFVPATYELINTYGMVNSSRGKHRKKVLGIPTLGDEGTVPIDDVYKSEGLRWSRKIVNQIQDSAYAFTNAQTCVLLAQMYDENGSHLKCNYDSVLYYYQKAEFWSQKTDSMGSEARENIIKKISELKKKTSKK